MSPADPNKVSKMLFDCSFVGSPGFIWNEHACLVQIKTDRKVQIVVYDLRIIFKPKASVAFAIGRRVVKSANRGKITDRVRSMEIDWKEYQDRYSNGEAQ
jgi:hypothetical protein